MASIASLIDRMDDYLQDRDDAAWSRDAKLRALLDETARLARFQLFGEINWQQGVAGTGRYSVADDTVEIVDVLYDGQVLHRTTEDLLDRRGANWEGTPGHPPQYWLTDHQAVNQFRIVPQPLDTGDATPIFPPVIFPGVTEKNLVVWRFINPQPAADESAESGLPTVLEDVAVFRSVSTLCGLETDFKEPAKQAFFRELAELYLQSMGVVG